ncbi:MAG: TonB-dependent receptor, partial [Bacteroidota bacterium]
MSVVLVLGELSVAQTRGRVIGTVRDDATSEGLLGANVTLKGTYYGAATDAEGRFVISNINPGEYVLEVSMLGYTPVQYTDVKVTAGGTVELDIRMKESVLQLDQEVVIIGERPLFDIQEASSARTIRSEEIRAAPVLNVQQVAARQVGITQTAEGIYIRGGRAYETAYLIDGVSAKDPLAGTGFGVDVSARSIRELEVITGGIGAEYGATAGVINVTTQEGDDRYQVSASYKKDNLWLNRNRASNFNTDVGEITVSGPIFPGKVTFFASLNGYFSDEFTRAPANQLTSSIAGGTRYAPRQDNRWSGMAKLTIRPVPEQKIQLSYRRSLNINQNTR